MTTSSLSKYHVNPLAPCRGNRWWLTLPLPHAVSGTVPVEMLMSVWCQHNVNMSWSLDIIQQEYIIMVIHDKLGKQAGEVVVFWLLRVMSQCGKVMHQQALIISQLKTLSTTGCRFSIVTCFLCEVSDLNTPTCRRKHGGIWPQPFVTSETNPVTSLLILFDKIISLKLIESFQRFHPQKNESPRNPLSYPFVASNLEWCLKLKSKSMLKTVLLVGIETLTLWALSIYFPSQKNVKHILGSITHEYITSSTW